MNEFTIEQVKALEIGDWIYIVAQNRQMYVQVCLRADGIVFEAKNYVIVPNYDNYGTTWSAYKNKELAFGETLSLTFPCNIGDKLFFVNRYKPTMQIETFTVTGFEVYEDANKQAAIRIFVKQRNYDRNYFDHSSIGDLVFFDINKANARLIELRSKHNES